MFLTYILSILLVTYRDGHALPISSSNATSLPWDSGILAVVDSNAHPSRTLFGVTWSCILTVFICAWTSVHPNVPAKGIGGLFSRIKLMFWTIVAPELVLAWAVRQWFAAREIRDIYNQHMEIQQLKPWTMAHGHFLEMGGFMLVSDKIHQFKEPAQPGWMSNTADWDSYNEIVKQRERCQLGTLTFERFKQVVSDPNVVFPAITPAQIQDRSKGDGLTKLLAILQTSWFILQCGARGLQGLALTELELVTLAMASLNGITFIFWWSKPLSVQEPVDVYLTVPAGRAPEKGDRNTVTDVEDDDGVRMVPTARQVIRTAYIEVKDMVQIIFLPQRRSDLRDHGFCIALVVYLVILPFFLFFVLISPLLVIFPLGIVFLLKIIKAEKVEKVPDDETVAARVVLSLRKLQYNVTHAIRRYFGRRMGYTPGLREWLFIFPPNFFLLVLILIILSPLFAIFFIASFTFTAAFEIVTTDTVRPGAAHVPSFYAPRTASDKYSRMIVFAIFGVIFGGIHCIAWNFSFPTHSERLLWRYTSLVLSAIPLVAAPIDCILENVRVNGRVGKMFRLLLGIFMTALLSLYVPARLSLIMQALALLRDQPATAYVAVDWTKYIPHLFS